jgi:protein gp37/uncharacterized protein YoxC
MSSVPHDAQRVNPLSVSAFDYSGLPKETAEDLRSRANRVRLSLKRTAQEIIMVGEQLAAAKEALPHGHFGAWLAAEFEMSQDTAERFLHVAERFGNDIPLFADYQPTVLYLLAAPSTPESVRGAVESGEVAPTPAAIKEAVEKAKKEILAQQKGEMDRYRARITELTDAIDTMDKQVKAMRNGTPKTTKAIETPSERLLADVVAKDRRMRELADERKKLAAHVKDLEAKLAKNAKAEARKAEPQRKDTPPAPAAPLIESFSIAQWNALDKDERETAIMAGHEGNAGLNEQKSDNIEWALWSWNPVTGCLHNCPYCYARDIANRFYQQGFTPMFLPSRLGAPYHQRVPAQAETELGYRNIFTCSMADLFGKWVPADWIEAVLDVARECPQWNFLFLTKFPNRLAEFTFPDNAWLGTSVDCQARVKNAEQSFAKVKGGVKWLSVEPMLEPLRFSALDMFDWVVIGGASASSQTPAWSPPRRWVDELEAAARAAGCMVYEKTNLNARWREYPGWERHEATLPDSLAYLPGMAVAR